MNYYITVNAIFIICVCFNIIGNYRADDFDSIDQIIKFLNWYDRVFQLLVCNLIAFITIKIIS